jgi:hypothetical protein
MMKNFKLLLTLCTGLICSPLAEAYSSSGIKKDVNETLNVQQKKIIISGIVTDAAGVPLIGATVSVSGSSSGGSITDKNGRLHH